MVSPSFRRPKSIVRGTSIASDRLRRVLLPFSGTSFIFSKFLVKSFFFLPLFLDFGATLAGKMSSLVCMQAYFHMADTVMRETLHQSATSEIAPRFNLLRLFDRCNKSCSTPLRLLSDKFFVFLVLFANSMAFDSIIFDYKAQRNFFLNQWNEMVFFSLLHKNGTAKVQAAYVVRYLSCLLSMWHMISDVRETGSLILRFKRNDKDISERR